MKPKASVFREYDIRGIAQTDLPDELAKELGRAYAERIRASGPRKRVSVGRDCRLSSDRLAEALIGGLLDGGLDVVDLGVVPTPVTYFSIPHLHLDGGIMVTGSHNAAEYNGFKVCVGKETLHGHQIQELRHVIERGPAQADGGRGRRESHDIIPGYVTHIVRGIRGGTRKKIVIDAGNGTASTVAPQLFRALGAEVIPLYCELDGKFPNHHPDPTVHENLKDLVDKVRETEADAGMAFDGDADRLGVVDEKGRIIFGDETLVILARAVLKENPGATIISEVKSSRRLYADIAAHGGKPLMWKTGHSLIKAKMKETGALLAGEMSGHIFMADRYFGYDDAIYAAARMYEIMSAERHPLSAMIADLPPAVATPEIRVDCSEELKFALVEETKAILSGSGHRINDIDGVRVDFGDSWGLVRASNTQPALVLRFEAPSQKRLEEIRLVIESALRDAAKKLGDVGLRI